MSEFDLSRFVTAHQQGLTGYCDDYNAALREIKAGKKRNHWMWYIFPQLAGLGYSSLAQTYAIHSPDEARAYFRHPYLGKHYLELCEALLLLETNDANAVMGSPDDMKLRSSLTLFLYACGKDPVIQRVLDKYYDGKPDFKTVQMLGIEPEIPNKGVFSLLSHCECVLPDEQADFRTVLDRFDHMTNNHVAFLPAIDCDLYPIYALECTSAKSFIDSDAPHVYIMPIGAHNKDSYPYFNNLVREFYENDTFVEQLNIELSEMILLKSPVVPDQLILKDGIEYNTIYCHLIMDNGKSVYLIITVMTPEDCWARIFEQYNISTDILIDSHKGLGDWFETVPLYNLMVNTKKRNLLPCYYFKGRYISHPAPEGFELVYTIPEEISNHGVIHDFEKRLFSTGWKSSKH